jgi:hypothetical protein
MSSIDSVSLALERFVAPFDDEPEAWADVLRRASVVSDAPVRRGTRRRRRLTVLVFATGALLALGLSPVGGALARGFGDFSAWLTGAPGQPASEDAQRAFEEGSARSWLKFPDGPKLRSLITTGAAGGRFELFGFRTGDSLCLRLTVEGIASDAPPALGCAPLAELRRADAPAVTVIVDYSFGRQDVAPNEEGYVPARASASFGVVADGVEAVELETNEERVAAIVGSNAFLAVTENPPLGLRTKELEAMGARGERVAVPLAEAPFGDFGAPARPGVAPGPTKIERRVEGGTIGWLLRREERGQSLEEAGIDASQIGFLGRAGSELRFARVISPDTQGHLPYVVAIFHFERAPTDPPFAPQGEHVCTLVAGGGGCSPIAHLFPPGIPFSVGTGSGYGGSQHVIVDGLASDDVARLELFLADGERMRVPLEDNVYVVEVARLKFPARLVAYDAEGRVIGIEAHVHDPLASYGPRPVAGKQRIVKRIETADGTATLRLGPSTEGTACYLIHLGDGRSSSGCLPKRHQGPALALNYDASGVVQGTVSPRVATIELRLEDGRRVRIEPLQGVVLAGLGAEPEAAIGYDETGAEVGRQPFPWRPPHAGG